MGTPTGELCYMWGHLLDQYVFACDWSNICLFKKWYVFAGDWSNICIREYQKELTEQASLHHNVIISAPTGCGKTIVALHMAKVNTGREIK